jgi:5-formyltetrahydrofolate cyclo-ligase
MTDTNGPDLAGLKARLRAKARAARKRIDDPVAAQALVRQFEASPWAAPRAGMVVAGYWPVNSEMDCRPLLRRLKSGGAVLVLPAVETLAAPLSFRLWNGEAPTDFDLMNMAVPASGEGTAVPHLVLVPLLLVDRTGHRLGYGGGYYDRTLSALRQAGKVTALGLAFDAQVTEKLPAAVDDMTLDGLVTEKGWMAFGGSGAAPSRDRAG